MLNSLWYVNQQPCETGRNAKSWATLWLLKWSIWEWSPEILSTVSGDASGITVWKPDSWEEQASKCAHLGLYPDEISCSSRSHTPVFHNSTSARSCWFSLLATAHRPFKTADTQHTFSLPGVLSAANSPATFPCVPSSTICALYIRQLSLKTFFRLILILQMHQNQQHRPQSFTCAFSLILSQ